MKFREKGTVFITIGFGNIGSGPWFYALNKLMGQEFRCIFLVRYSPKWKFSQGAKNLNIFIEDTNKENCDYISSIPVTTTLDELYDKIRNNKIVIFLYKELEDISEIFGYVKNVFTCLGPGFEEVIRRLHRFGFSNNIYALENNQKNIELIKMDLLKQGTRLNIYPTILDCIATGQHINEENLVVKYETKGYFNIMDPDNNLDGVFKNNVSEIIINIHTSMEKYEPLKIKKEVSVNIPHRILCYLYLLYCNKDNEIKEYKHIISIGETDIRDILKIDIIITSFEQITNFVIIGKNAILSYDGLMSFYEGIEIQRARYANYIMYIEEALKAKKRFEDTKDDAIARIIKTDSVSYFIERVIETKIYMEDCIKGIKDAIEYKLYGDKIEEEYLKNGICTLDNFIREVLEFLIEITK